MNGPSLPSTLLALALAAPVFLTQCAKNPADDVDAATVGELGAEQAAPVAVEEEVIPVVYVFTDDSKVGFTGSKVTGAHSGGFTNFTGQFEIVGEKLSPAGSHRVRIDMKSLYTDDDRLTEHLLGPDFFDTEKIPLATFELDQVTPREGEADRYDLSGTLDLHGKTKSISFPAKVTGDKDRIDVEAEFKINRMDFGIVYPGKADDLIREDVVIRFNIGAAPGEPKSLQLGGPDLTAPAPGGPGDGGVRGKGKGGKGGDGRGKGGRGWGTPEERAERFASTDANGDGVITQDEFSACMEERMAEHMAQNPERAAEMQERMGEMKERIWGFMSQADADGDSGLTFDELEAGRERMEAERASGRGGDRGGPRRSEGDNTDGSGVTEPAGEFQP